MFSFFVELSTANPLQIRNINFSPVLGKASPGLDVYSFANAENAPVVIYVHGGGWQRGSKKQVNLKPKHFNDNGYVFVSIDYRLVPKFRVEDQLQDIDDALWWIHNNIGVYGGSGNNLHLMGHSAGAHLVSLSAVKPLAHIGKLSALNALRSIISVDTLAYDVPRIASARYGKLHPVYEAAFGRDETRWKQLSPQYHIESNVNIPPFLLIYSGQGITRARQIFARRFARELRVNGVRVTVFDGSKYTHRQITVAIGEDNDLTKAIDDFLRNYR